DHILHFPARQSAQHHRNRPRATLTRSSVRPSSPAPPDRRDFTRPRPILGHRTALAISTSLDAYLVSAAMCPNSRCWHPAALEAYGIVSGSQSEGVFSFRNLETRRQRTMPRKRLATKPLM